MTERARKTRAIDVRATRTIVRDDDADFTIVILQGTPGQCYGAEADGGLFVTWQAVLVSAPKRPTAADADLTDAGVLLEYPEENVDPRDVEVAR